MIALSIGEIAPLTDFLPWIRLVGPTGTLLGNTWNLAGAQITLNAPTTGTYTIIVGTNDAGLEATGR